MKLPILLTNKSKGYDDNGSIVGKALKQIFSCPFKRSKPALKALYQSYAQWDFILTKEFVIIISKCHALLLAILGQDVM